MATPAPPPATPWNPPWLMLGGLATLVAGNALLPAFYDTHPIFKLLDYLGVFALSFWTAGLAWRRARQEGPAAFGLLGLGAALGGLRYAPTFLGLSEAALLGPALSILGLLALGIGFLRWPQRVRMPRDRMRTLLDGLALGLALFTAAWLTLGTLESVGQVSRGLAVVYAAQISSCLGLLALWLLQETRLRWPEQEGAKRFVRWALVALLMHSAASSLLRITGHYQAGYLGHASEVLHQVATLLLALAALSPALPLRQAAPTPKPASPWRALIPSLVSLMVLLVAVIQAHSQPQAAPTRVLAGLVLALLGVLMLRHGLLILDLERLSHDLEARVEARTRSLEAHHQEALAGLRVRVMAGLAAGLAHDLNNILAIIRLRLDLLQESCQASQAEDLEVLRGASERAIAMTQRILASGKFQEPLPVDLPLSDWLVERTGLLRALLKPDQRLAVDGGTSLRVQVDPEALDQILQNLLANAREALGPGGGVWVTARGVGASVVLEVKDDGPGIPPEHLDHVFDPFFTTKPEGTGLGLATVRNLVVQNRGTLRVESLPGTGAAFLITLPVPDGEPMRA